MIVGRVWLRWWVQAGAGLSNMGMFVTEMSSDSFQLLGMAEPGMLPEFFAKRSRYGTPYIGILFSASGFIAFIRTKVKDEVSRFLALSAFKVMGLSVFAIVIGLVLRPFLKYVEKKRWAKFSTSADLPDLHNAHETNKSLVR
ncbi:amino acid permease-like protein [Tanacetum coccineum]